MVKYKKEINIFNPNKEQREEIKNKIEKLTEEGRVIQVIEGDGEVQIRLAVNGDYDNIMYCAYNSSIVTSRVLEDDYITVMGKSSDLITYTSTMGGEITIPSMVVEKIDM